MHCGPYPLPGTGYAAIRQRDRGLVYRLTNVTFAIRKRPSWDARMLTLSGPAHKIPEAKAMATALILKSQEEKQEGDPYTGPILPQRIATHVNGNTLQLPEYMTSVPPPHEK